MLRIVQLKPGDRIKTHLVFDITLQRLTDVKLPAVLDMRMVWRVIIALFLQRISHQAGQQPADSVVL